MKYINLIRSIACIIVCFIGNRISSQDSLNMKISFDSISTTIFSQEKIDVQLVYSDSANIKYYSGVSGIEIDFGDGSWMLYKNPITSSSDEPSYMLKNMCQFINLPGLFCRDTSLFNSIKNTGCEIKLRFRLYCSIDSSPFEYRYSGIKKMVLPPANSDDINALTFLTEQGIDSDFFSWLHNFPEETETIFTYVKDNFPNSVLSDRVRLQFDVYLGQKYRIWQHNTN